MESIIQNQRFKELRDSADITLQTQLTSQVKGNEF